MRRDGREGYAFAKRVTIGADPPAGAPANGFTLLESRIASAGRPKLVSRIPPLAVDRSQPHRRPVVRRLAVLLALPWCAARALERPTGPVILTIRGSLSAPNAGTMAQFDMAMLEQLPQHSFTTRTPWYSQARKFTGPLLRDVLTACGAQGRTLRAVALNDYRVDLPFEDVQRYDVLLARLLDDQPMAVRDKGPLFIIYPFDTDPALRSPIFYGRSAWQLKSIEVL